MHVGELARGSVTTLEVDDTLLDAAREMEDSQAAVCVSESGELVGIITLRDVVRAVAEGAALDRTPLEEYMTASPVTLGVEADLEEALRLMLEGEFRHLPVLDDDEEIVGIVGMRDLARVLFQGVKQAERARR